LLRVAVERNQPLISQILNYYTVYTYESLEKILPAPVYEIDNCLFYFYILICVLFVSIVFLNGLENGQIINHADVKSNFLK